MVGITRYSYELLRRLLVDSPYDWFLYLDRPCVHTLPESSNICIREGRCKGSFTSTVYAQLVFPLWAKKDKIDVFWSPRHHLPLLLGKNIKTVLTIHDLVWKFYPETMSALGRHLESILMPPSVRRADKVIAVSESTAMSLARHLAVPHHKLTTIHLASHLSRDDETAESNAESDYFLFVGTLEPRKNLKRLLEAFSIALDRNLSIRRLKVIGGGGWGGVDIEDLITGYGIDANVELLGRVSSERLDALYRGAYALVMPSLYEGFGLPLLESMSLGVPVVSSNVSSIPEVVGEGGLLIDDPCSVEQISEALLEIASNKALYARVCEKAKYQSSQFSWDKSASATMSVLSSCFLR
jgi:glycosyltransferase involved in cell wall biosynthesis